MIKEDKTNYLIIGNSVGGISAAEAIRRVDKSEVITIISDEPYPAYSRPLISEHLASGYPLERMLFRPPDFYEKSNIRTIFNQKVMRLDFNRSAVELGGGRRLAWEKLLLATGGSPIVPEIEGTGLKGIFTFNKLDDARAIDELLNQYGRKIRAVVIGGGLIGVSATEALVKRGVRVTVIEMKDRVLNTILDEEASALEKKALTQAGVEIITEHTVNKISSSLSDEATGVFLDDGRSIPCEMVVIAIGVRPRLELVSDSSIKTNRGIVVDRHMATSRLDVYACGDVAEAYDFVYGENRLSPIWPNACLEGRIAGLNMAGIPTEYQGGTTMNSVKYFGVNIVSAGVMNPSDDSHEIISEHHGDIYKKVVVKNGLITGLIFAGDIEKSGIVYNLMKDRVNVDSFKEFLIADDLSLASLPEQIRQVKLAIPSSASIIAPFPAEQLEEAVHGE